MPLDWNNLNYKQRIFLKVACSHLGRPYDWAGDDPMEGWDCSGLVRESLLSVGLYPLKRDASAHDICHAFAANQFVTRPDSGVIVFFANDDQHVYHTAICLYPDEILEAGGGGSNVVGQVQTNIRIKGIKDKEDEWRHITLGQMLPGDMVELVSKSTSDAERANAYVRIRPYRYDPEHHLLVNPFIPKE